MSVHRNIRYVGAPELIGPGDGQVPEKIRINLVCLVRLAGVGLLVDRCQTHFPHQPGDTVTPNLVAQPLQMPPHPARAIVRALHVSLIRQPHQRQAFRVFPLGYRLQANSTAPGSALRLSCLCCIARRIDSVVMVLPCRICPILPLHAY